MNVFPFTTARRSRGFTLIEIMVATTLGLMLVMSLVKIVAMVNNSFHDARLLIDLQNRCRSTQALLQSDISHISVVPEAPRPSQAEDGYLCIGTITVSDIYQDNKKLYRGGLPVCDLNMREGNCDFISFTMCNVENPFKYQYDGIQGETPLAEVVWYVFKNDLYRVVVPLVNEPEEPRNYYFPGTSYKTNYAFRDANSNRIPDVRMISPAQLAFYPKSRLMYYSSSRLLWDEYFQFNNTNFCLNLANRMVMPNVLSFKVQLYNPEKKEYCNLDKDKLGTYYDANSKTVGDNTAIYYDTGSSIYGLENASGDSALDGSAYRNRDLARANAVGKLPSSSFIPGMRIVIRAFDPDSGQIREFRVTRDFRTK